MKTGVLAAIVIAIVALVVVMSATFTVHQTEEALVLRFGELIPDRGLVTEPGLHFKVPLIESVVPLDKRILDLETPQQEVLASDNQRILVDAFVRYHISDPLRFYQTVGDLRRADNQLGSVLNSALRRVLGEATQTQIVRDDRAGLMIKIRDLVNTEGQRLGVSVNDVRIRRADLPPEISEKVFSRMQSERQRQAAEYRAQGSEQAQTITAKADRDVVVLKAEAKQAADQVRGAGDAERNHIYADAFGKDHAFFAFYRSMQAYDTAITPRTSRLVMTPRSDFFRFFSNPAGTAPPPTVVPTSPTASTASP